jgi:hypothetical protein
MKQTLILLISWLAAIGNAQPADQHQTNQYVADLREFINHEYNDFEITYSKDGMVFSATIGSPVIRTNFETDYYFLRRSPDGFLFHRGNTVAVLESSNLLRLTYGVDSKSRHYWSAGPNGLLVVDEKKLEKLHDQAGKTWTDLFEDACPGVLTYGLYIKKGSIVWDGNKFTAYTSSHIPVISEKRNKPLITGELFLSNGLPSLIKYSYASNDFDLYLSYTRKVDSPMLLPNLLHAEERYRGARTDSYTMELQSFRLTNFAVSSTALEAITSNVTNINIVIDKRDGRDYLVSIRGKKVKPIAVNGRARSFEKDQDKPRSRHPVIWMLICGSLLVPAVWIYLSKKPQAKVSI